MRSRDRAEGGSKRQVRIKTACALLEISREQFDEIVNMAPAFAEAREIDLLRIARALVVLLPQVGFPAQWLRAPNSAPILNGGSAFDAILNDAEILPIIRQYLEAEIHR